MKLFNLSQHTCLSETLEIASTFSTRSIGLLGKPKGISLWLKTRWGIHTFGMGYPLTIIICDGNFRIKVVKEKLLPSRLFFWNPIWYHVIELPYSTYQLNLGDVLEIKSA